MGMIEYTEEERILASNKQYTFNLVRKAVLKAFSISLSKVESGYIIELSSGCQSHYNTLEEALKDIYIKESRDWELYKDNHRDYILPIMLKIPNKLAAFNKIITEFTEVE